MKKSLITILVIVVVALIVIAQSAYIVRESEQVIITQFGKPVGDAVKDAGIHFKVPFVQTANFFDKRYLEWDGDPNQVPTKDKKFIFVDTYARWQITDPLQFFKRLTNERGAQSRLDDILDGETRDFIANNYLEEAVRTSNRTPISSGAISEIVEDSLVQINVGRDSIQEYIQKSANLQTQDLGIEILDFRFKRINYVEEVRTQVYERMKSERFRIADKFRSEGQGEASRINGEKERELKSIQSEAFKIAEQIKGKADAEAAAIYANAYNKNNASRELYSFLKSMETFQRTFNSETTVILSTDSDLYKYLKSMD
ncbi:protein HflC [Marivirga tractuosa]|uniref:Protein HflC n=1 Tax=Marivirga tractuosa (strain ATCC 23168 / DSM 4126 / NBRC 15989 / NCIMB 1408 / VKM B-1430 / H-43) TaxID=643867 RepID=E4TRE3_MARTH|nr:protease modulator HflC [Marivirga tractuosa]ADR20677.1 protease FtsH subunit HflC [Marivirga tractuosa DSM 4126]BDD14873.1 protein HflC [Marivirga tractuosa]